MEINKSFLGLILIVYLVGTLFISLSFAWYGSADYMRDITQETTSDIAVYINNTTGMNGENILINPSQCANGNVTIYYNSSSDLAIVCNDTFEMNWSYEKTGTGNNPTGIFNSNLKAYYSFGQTTQCNDSSSNNNDGTLGGATHTSSGKYGYAYDFDGNTNYIQFSGLESGYSLHDNWSVSAWFNYDTTIPVRDEIIYVGEAGAWGSPYGDCFTLEVKNVGGNCKLSCWVYAKTDDIQGTTTLSSGIWYMGTLTYEASVDTIRLYLNGILEKTKAGAGVSDATIGEFGIGANVEGTKVWGQASGNRFEWDGPIGEVRIYNGIILTQTQISEIYNQSVGVYNNFGSEEVQSGNNPPSITINKPENITYHNISIPVNVTVSESDSASFWCAIYEDGNLLTNETTNTTYTTTLTKTGGSHNVSVSCLDSDNQTSSDSVTYYIWMGLNISTYYNNGTEATNWNISITNTTSNYTNSSLNNTHILEWNTIPTGEINITVNDGSDTLFYYENLTQTNNNNSAYQIFNITLTEKEDNPINLTANPSWNIYRGDSLTINCSTPEGTPYLYRDKISISIPDISSYEVGTFDFRCEVPTETTNYRPTNTTNTLIVNSLFGCTDNETFVYNLSVTTATNLTGLNFSDLVNDNIIRANLGDIYIKNVSNIWRNGSILIVNNTGLSSFDVLFSNFYVNNNYSSHTLPASIQNVESYQQINKMWKIELFDELTGENMYPPNTTSLYFILNCAYGYSYITLEENKTYYVIATKEKLNYIYLKIKYSASDFYSRNYYVLEDQNAYYIPFYLINAYERALDKIDFIMDNPEYYNCLLEIYTTIGESSITITSGYFDISHLFSAYLGEDNLYNLKLYCDGGWIEIGKVLVNEPAEKHIEPTTTLVPSVTMIYENLVIRGYFQNASADTTNLIVTYEDKINKTENVTIIVYNLANDSVFHNLTYYTPNIELSLAGANTSEDYYITFEINHEELGNSPVSEQLLVSNLSKDILIGGASVSWLYPILAFALMFFIATIITPKNLISGTITLITILAFTIMFGWLTINTTILVLFGFMFVLGIVLHLKEGSEEE